MNNYRLKSQYIQIKDLFDRVKALKPDDELRAHLTRYLCVLISGFLENSIRIIYGDYVSNKKQNQRILNFVESHLKRFQNADTDDIIKLAERFDKTWASEIRQATEGPLRASINTIVSNRHLIAHGASSPNLDLTRVEDYFKDVVTLVDLIEKQCQKYNCATAGHAPALFVSAQSRRDRV